MEEEGLLEVGDAFELKCWMFFICLSVFVELYQVEHFWTFIYSQEKKEKIT